MKNIIHNGLPESWNIYWVDVKVSNVFKPEE